MSVAALLSGSTWCKGVSPPPVSQPSHAVTNLASPSLSVFYNKMGTITIRNSKSFEDGATVQRVPQHPAWNVATLKAQELWSMLPQEPKGTRSSPAVSIPSCSKGWD